MSNNDLNTRVLVRGAQDQVNALFAHFSEPGATWNNFTRMTGDTELELLKLHLEGLLQCVESELQARNAVEPTDFGT